MQKKSLLTIFVIVFVDLLGFSLILPLLPYYASAYGATPTITGFLVASYAAAQFVGAPLIGRLSDRYGRRLLLLVSIAGTFLGFLILGFAEPLGRALSGGADAALTNRAVIGILFLSRMLDGLTGGNLSVAQAYITDVTDESNRARGLGLIGAAFGLGFIIGPAIGGTLSLWGYAAPAFAAAGLSLLNLGAVALWLPESLTPERRAQLAHSPRTAFTLQALTGALKRPRVGPLLQVRILSSLAFNTFQTIFSLYAATRLGLSVQSTAYVLTYVGVLSVLVQGVAIGWITAHLSETRIILASVTLMCVSLLAWALVPNLPLLLIVLAPMSLAGGTFGTVISSAITKAVLPEEVGGTLGLSASLESLTRVIAPSAGGVLLQRLGTWAPGVFGAIIMAWVVAYVWRRLIVNPDPPLQGRDGGASIPKAVVGES